MITDVLTIKMMISNSLEMYKIHTYVIMLCNKNASETCTIVTVQINHKYIHRELHILSYYVETIISPHFDLFVNLLCFFFKCTIVRPLSPYAYHQISFLFLPLLWVYRILLISFSN